MKKTLLSLVVFLLAFGTFVGVSSAADTTKQLDLKIEYESWFLNKIDNSTGSMKSEFQNEFDKYQNLSDEKKKSLLNIFMIQKYKKIYLDY